MKKVRINQGRIVPWQFRLAGSVFVIMLIFGAFIKLEEIYAIICALLLSPLVPLLWSSFYLLEIDPVAKTVTEISWMMGIQKKEVTRFEGIEKIFINPVRVSQRVTSYSGHVNDFKSQEYMAYLKLDSGQKFELVSDRNADHLRKRLEEVRKKLDCEVVDNF